MNQICISLILLYFLQIGSPFQVLCRHCSHPITKNNGLKNIKSFSSLNSSVKNIYGKSNILTHTFKNPYGVLFEVATFEEANLICEKVYHPENTFFPGYGWSICICPICGEHQGWKFSPILSQCEIEEKKDECISRKTFFGLKTADMYNDGTEYVEL